jgi:LPXTG-motif cell wall-anchored protein
MRRQALLGLFLALLGTLLVASPGAAAAAVKAKRESYQAFLAQVSKGDVKTAVLVPKKTIVRAKLKSGARYTAKYPATDRKRLVSLLHQRKVHVSFAKPKKKKHTSTGIRKRYLALGVVGLAALASAGWMFMRRRRSEE